MAIEIKNLYKSFLYYNKEQGVKGSLRNLFHKEILTKEAVKNLSFYIKDGEIVGFLGPNGAGKTTTLKMLSGILYPSNGTIRVNGYDPAKREKDFKRSMSIILGQKSQLQWDLPAIESFYLNKVIYGIGDKEYKENLEELVSLLNVSSLLNVQVRRLSLGERMKMEIISSLIHKPKVLFLDEPTIGLDFVSQDNIRDFFQSYAEKEKATILLTSHNLDDIARLCKRTIIINNGNLQYDGQTDDLKQYSNRKFIKFRVSQSDIPFLENQNLKIEMNDNEANLEVLDNELNKVLSVLLSKCDVRDLRIEEYPLEKIIASMYLK